MLSEAFLQRLDALQLAMRAPARGGQNGPALFFQRLFDGRRGGVFLLYGLLGQLDDLEAGKGAQAFLVFGHALSKIFCVALAHADELDVLHGMRFLSAAAPAYSRLSCSAVSSWRSSAPAAGSVRTR